MAGKELIKFLKYLIYLCFLISVNVYGYEQFVGYGYTSCLTCHYNPYGNGPLNSYGRAVSASAISAKDLYLENYSDEFLANRSSFTFGKNTKKYNVAANVRQLRYSTNYNTKSESTTYMLMQANVNFAGEFGTNNQFITVASIGYSPAGEEEESYRTREHYLGYKYSDQLRLYLGLMDKAFGLRLDNHTAFSRVATRNTMDDQTHGLLTHYLSEKHEWGIQVFLGNLADDEDTTRQKGISGKYEYISDSFTKYGLSVLKADSEYLESLMTSVHMKIGFSEGSSFISEYGQVQNTGVETNESITQEYIYTQATVLMKRGLSLLFIGEYYDQDKSSEGYSIRYGPGIQYFPIQRIEFRADLLNSRSIATVATEENLQLLTQLHLWF